MTTTLRWVGLALLGILIAAAISIAASRLASQQIGLASQPITAGDALAPVGHLGKNPAPVHSGAGAHRPHSPPAPTQPVPVEPVPVEPVQPITPTPPESVPAPSEHRDDSGGGGRGGGADD